MVTLNWLWSPPLLRWRGESCEFAASSELFAALPIRLGLGKSFRAPRAQLLRLFRPFGTFISELATFNGSKPYTQFVMLTVCSRMYILLDFKDFIVSFCSLASYRAISKIKTQMCDVWRCKVSIACICYSKSGLFTFISARRLNSSLSAFFFKISNQSFCLISSSYGIATYIVNGFSSGSGDAFTDNSVKSASLSSLLE